MNIETGEIVDALTARKTIESFYRGKQYQGQVAETQERVTDLTERPAFVLLTTEQNDRLSKIQKPHKRLQALRKLLVTKSCLNCRANYLNHDNAQLVACLKALAIPVMDVDSFQLTR